MNHAELIASFEQPTILDPITPSPQQEKAIEYLLFGDKQVRLLMGKAGTGKSFVLEKVIEQLNANHKDEHFVVGAPTGTAALNINGCTLHSLFSFTPADTLTNVGSAFAKKLTQVTLLIIDEVSMVRADFMDMCDIVLQNTKGNGLPFGGIDVILCGDVSQLPPVVTTREQNIITQNYESEFFFSSKVWKRLVREKQVSYNVLTEGFRQRSDPDFAIILDAIRDNKVTPGQIMLLNEAAIDTLPPGDTAVMLTKSNRQKDSHNAQMLDRITSDEYFSDAVIKGNLEDWQITFAKKFKCKVGSRVMCIKNTYGDSGVLEVSNGDLGTVYELWRTPHTKQLCAATVLLDRTNTHYTFDPITWIEGYNEYDPLAHQTVFKKVAVVSQFPLVLANAITVHKAQGATLDNIVLDLREGMGDPGMLYTAITRCRTLVGLRTIGLFNKFSFAYAPQVQAFLQMADEHNELAS